MSSTAIDGDEEMDVISEVEIGDSDLMLYQKTKTPETFWVRYSSWKDEAVHYAFEKFNNFDAAESAYMAAVKTLAEPEMDRLHARLSRGQTSTFAADIVEFARLAIDSGELSDEGLDRIIEQLRVQIESVSEPVN